MSMSMTMSPTNTMSMPMSTSSSMDMSSPASMMGMSSMAMTFFTSSTTPLFSMSWTPTTVGQYAGTCIFLIVFSAIFRGLLAVRVNLFQVMRVLRRDEKEGALYVRGEGRNIRPWRANEAAWIACMDVVLGGIAYLLMIAVMTMNVGYFLSVLAGIGVGSFVFGRFMASSASH
ncbi:Ctr copper transporter family-domain-containing protein [Rhexocercosporidium sp. MPI-PUGE-AT-0058]|nr:Ctr copper transporter family-domain-containing protein [Rhexocercosporidium sp. MPI-PUGE-AT-0058]